MGWVGTMWYKVSHGMSTHATPHIADLTGANLRAARQARQMTQRQVADLVGVTNRDVSRWENGGVEPGPKYRRKLAEVLFDGDLSAMYAEAA